MPGTAEPLQGRSTATREVLDTVEYTIDQLTIPVSQLASITITSAISSANTVSRETLASSTSAATRETLA